MSSNVSSFSPAALCQEPGRGTGLYHYQAGITNMIAMMTFQSEDFIRVPLKMNGELEGLEKKNSSCNCELM
eukprot:scaffold34921_cov162-Amphora_coffeaeformis.AAC.11